MLRAKMKINWLRNIVFLLVGIAIGLGISTRIGSFSAAPKIERKTNSIVQRFGGPNEPGGIIEALKVPFNDQSEIFVDRSTRLKNPQWFFEKFSVPQLTEFLAGSSLTPEQMNDLAKTSRVEIATNGCLLTPTDYLVRSLSPASRSRIYSALEISQFNFPQQFPFRFSPNDFDSRFDGSGLSPEKLQTIRSLTYTNAGDLCLADIHELSRIFSTNDFQRAIEFLYRFPVYRLRLRVMQDSNVDALVNYWGRGGREQKIQPLISSLAKVPKTDGSSINISYLLPNFPRLRLYTFPSSWKNTAVEKQDCFWSSMNFFNDQPDEKFFAPDHTKRILQSEYHIVREEPKFGDLITLFNTNGNGLHMCVYLADNFVFTKNGINTLSPWVIMKMSDMLLLYFPSKTERKFLTYRRNDLS